MTQTERRVEGRRGEEGRGEERRGGERRGEEGRGGERKGEERRGEERKGEDYIKYHHQQGDFRVYYMCFSAFWPKTGESCTRFCPYADVRYSS